MRLAAAVWAIAAAASASDDGGVAVLSAPQLTAKLQRAKSPHELVLLHASHSDAFDVIHLSALWSRAKELAPPGKPARRWLHEHAHSLEPLCNTTASILPSFDGRRLATLAHTLSGVFFSSHSTPFLPYVRADSSHIPPFNFFFLECCFSLSLDPISPICQSRFFPDLTP